MGKLNMGRLTKKPIDNRKYRDMKRAWLMDEIAKLKRWPWEGTLTVLGFYKQQLRALTDEDRLEMLEERVAKLEKRLFGR